MLKKLNKILKFFVFIFVIKTTFLVSFGSGLLGEDLGFDLYKTIDKGIGKLESQNFSYELKGQKPGGKIKDEINRILAIKQYGKCKIEKDISESEFKEITIEGNIGLLKSILSAECGDDLSILNGIELEMSDFKNILDERAEFKTKKIFEVSRIGLYTDGSLDNSPFDLVKDIKDIDYIIFTSEIPYRGDKSINDEEAARWANDINNELDRVRNFGNRDNNSNLSPHEQDNQDIQNAYRSNIPPIPSYIINQDNTNKVCASNESGLDSEETNTLLINSSNPINSGQNDNLQNHSEGGNNNGSESLAGVQNLEEIKSDYFKVTDDKLWDCSKFFCIKVDFITYQHSLFGGSKTRSIQSIIERSNEHLKKIVNTSLVQAKMTTDNFELGLKDLDLPSIFSFGMVITKKTPPILNLEQFQQDKEQIKKNDKFSSNNNFCRRWEAFGLNCKRENDLTIFNGTDIEEKNINNSAELDINHINKKYQELKLRRQEKKLMGDFMSKAISNDAQKNETEALYKEFLELERFVANMSDYTNSLKDEIEKMLKIPISGS